MNIGRSLTAAVTGLLLFFFLALDLVLFGVLPLSSILVTVLPVVGFLLGAVVGAFVPKHGAVAAPAAVPAAPMAAPAAPMAPAPMAPPPVAPPPGAPGPAFVPTHTVPPGGLPTWPVPDATGPSNGHLDPGLAVRVVGQQGEWAQVRCENGWEAWVKGSVLVPGR